MHVVYSRAVRLQHLPRRVLQQLTLTILGLAGAVVWLRQVALHTGAAVGAFSVCTGLTAGPVHSALIKI